MQDYTHGQRWISDSEPELGLGLILEIEHRMLTVEFPESGETRLYARESAPLTRISFNPGDEIHDREQNPYEVLKVENVDGLLIYQVKKDGNELSLPETALSDAISLNQPLSRLLTGQVDHSHWFELRVQALDALHFIEQSSLLGLCSARTELIPHQLFISNEVAQRYAPRVLLADEVGLGKTIEACLILQQQLFSGLASRILIIVPETLLHQWLVELLRRFNLSFSIFDAERCIAIAEDSGENPFFTEQLVLCSSELFIHSPELHSQALVADWDLLIVDEAHHLKPAIEADIEDDSAKELSVENIAYNNIESLSKKVQGLILLTATPDQLGQESHFALLRLLDPGRFHNFNEFEKEQDSFIEIASLIEQLESLKLPSKQSQTARITTRLTQLFKSDESIKKMLQNLNDEKSRADLIRAIVDRHGTGRILFRNTRKLISGFPKRCLHEYPLACPELYQAHLNSLNPEISFLQGKQWLKNDPRVACVEALLLKYKQEKILLICASKETAMDLEEYLRLRKGLRTSVFHENMSILERDRAAAYFADKQSGAQILLCSEIGSEGRNFQFSHHLVLFDLPINPDLLEQRIGRLDRIGQKHTINIHVPYLQNSAQESLFIWYRDGLNAFQFTNPAAYKVFQSVHSELDTLLFNSEQLSDTKLADTKLTDTKLTDTKLSDFIQRSHALNEQFLGELSKGRDRLLEINSFNAKKSQNLLKKIALLESSSSPKDFLGSVFDNFGLETEENSDHSWVVQPGESMVIDSFPAVPDQGVTITYDRQQALHREDVQFVNWHHPLIEQSIDIILQGDLGKSVISVLDDKRFESGTLLLESLFRINVSAPKELQLKRFLPSTTIRVLMDNKRRDLSKIISNQELNKTLQHVDKSHLMGLLNEHKENISEINHYSEQIAMEQLPGTIKLSSEKMISSISSEIKRLVALKQINPNIRDEELNFLKKQMLSLHKSFTRANLQLEAIRLIFVA